MKLSLLFKYILGWLVYSALFTLALIVQGRIIPFVASGLEIEMQPLLELTGKTFVRSLFLVLTGYLIFAFLSIAFWSHNQWGGTGKSRVIMIVLLYALTTASIVVTYLVAFKSLDANVLIDAAFMNAVALIVFSVIPYFSKSILR